MLNENIIEGEIIADDTNTESTAITASTYGDFYAKAPFTDPAVMEQFGKTMEARSKLEKYQEFILTIPSQFALTTDGITDRMRPAIETFWRDISQKTINYLIPLTEIKDESMNLSGGSLVQVQSSLSGLLTSKLTVGEQEMIKFIPRYFAEENMSFVQFVSVVVIKSEDGRYLMLQNNTDNAMDGKTTFIQGHVSYDNTSYLTQLQDFLIANAIKELDEEIALVKGDLDTTVGKLLERDIRTPSHFVYSKKDLISLEHFGFIHTVELTPESFDYLVANAASNEPEKHTLVVVNHDGDHSTLDTWSKLIIDKI